MASLVERLRQGILLVDSVPQLVPALDAMHEAADRIEALEAQLECQGRLVDWYQEQHPEQLAVIETLRAALDKIIASEADPLDYEHVVAIARAALKESETV